MHRWPRAARAIGKPSMASPKPPVLENGATSPVMQKAFRHALKQKHTIFCEGSLWDMLMGYSGIL